MMSRMGAAEVCLEQVGSRFSFRAGWSALRQSIAKLHCELMHKSLSRPVNGKYRCWTCLKEFDTNW